MQVYCRRLRKKKSQLLQVYCRSIAGLLQLPVKKIANYFGRIAMFSKFFSPLKNLIAFFLQHFFGVGASGKIRFICCGCVLCVPNFVSRRGVLRWAAAVEGERHTGVVATQTGRQCFATSGRPVARATFFSLCKNPKCKVCKNAKFHLGQNR